MIGRCEGSTYCHSECSEESHEVGLEYAQVETASGCVDAHRQVLGHPPRWL